MNMKLIVTPAAAKQIQQRWQLTKGTIVRLAPANGPHHGPHQRIIPKAGKQDAVYKTTVDGLTFVVTYEDEWFFSGLVTTLDYDQEDGLRFSFADHQGRNPDAVTGASNKYEWMWY